MTERKKSEKPVADKPHEVSTAEAVRDIFVAAINSGQFAILLVFVFLMFYLYRLPPEHLASLTHDTMRHLISGEGWSYMILLIGGLAIRVYIRSVRVQFDREISKYKAIIEQKQENPLAIAPPTQQKPPRRQP